MGKVAIIDFGSSFTFKVVNNINSIGESIVMFKENVKAEQLKNFDHIIFTGSPDACYNGGRQVDKDILDLNIPILGICYGHQLIHYLLGGTVQRAEVPEEKGLFELFLTGESKIFANTAQKQLVKMYHFDEVTKMADGFENLAHTPNCKIASTQNVAKKLYTVQFHPEDEGNQFGREILENFIKNC